MVLLENQKLQIWFHFKFFNQSEAMTAILEVSGHNFGRDHHIQVWFNLIQWFFKM